MLVNKNAFQLLAYLLILSMAVWLMEAADISSFF